MSDLRLNDGRINMEAAPLVIHLFRNNGLRSLLETTQKRVQKFPTPINAAFWNHSACYSEMKESWISPSRLPGQQLGLFFANL